MVKGMKWIFSLFLLSLALFFMPQNSEKLLRGAQNHDDHIEGVLKNVYGEPVRWVSFPVEIYVDRSVPVSLMPSVNRAIVTWNKMAQRYTPYSAFFVLAGWTEGQELSALDGRNVISLAHRVSASQEFLSTEQAVTTRHWVQGGAQMIEGDVVLNTNKKLSTDLREVSETELDSVALLVHELGHVLGLEHVSHGHEATVMSKHLPGGAFGPRVPGDIDINALDKTYNFNKTPSDSIGKNLRGFKLSLEKTLN